MDGKWVMWEARNSSSVLVAIPRVKVALRSPRHRLRDDIKMDLR